MHTCTTCNCVRLVRAGTLPIQPATEPQPVQSIELEDTEPPKPVMPTSQNAANRARLVKNRKPKETVSKQGFSRDEVSITPGARLHYYRCWDCLEIGSSEELLPYKKKGWNADARRITEAKCACNGPIDYLGQTTEDRKRLEKEVEKSVCDARCTNATGPNCNCKCDCANHGTGRVVKVIKTGALPKFEYSPDIQESAVLRGTDYRQLIADLKKGIADAQLPSYIPWSSRNTNGPKLSSYDAQNRLNDIMELTNYKNRIDRARKLFDDLQLKDELGEPKKLVLFSEAPQEEIDWRPTEAMPEDFYSF